jgi:nucleotide-binding universal stress UspA family protein
MTIVCGTDFSQQAAEASAVAATLAKHLGVGLKLVHASDETEGADGSHPAVARLEQEARALSGSHACDIEPILVEGHADEGIVSVAEESSAKMIVVSSLGRRKRGYWLLGSVAEKVVQASPFPVLVIRGGGALAAWARRERPLRIMVGVDISAASRAACNWVGWLRTIAPCDVTIAHLAWPPAEHARLGIVGPMPLNALRPEVEELLRRDVQQFVGQLPGEGNVSFVIQASIGRVDHHITQLAERSEADLLVMGTHQRSGISRLLRGSVSRGVVHLAPMSVACIPSESEIEVASETVSPPLAQFKSVLVPTDFSDHGSGAVRYAYSITRPGGLVHLIHVSDEDDGASEDRLRALCPPEASAWNIRTETEIIHSMDVPVAICQAAERHGTDAICMATHGRSGQIAQLMGSVTKRVLERSRRPILLVPPALLGD